MGFSLSMAARNVFVGCGNVLFNGFEFDIKEKDKHKKIPVTIKHFNPFGSWEITSGGAIDRGTGDRYDDDSLGTIRLKCAAVFAATPIAQSIGLLLNLVNRVGKVILLAHLWAPSSGPYDLKARLTEMGKDLLRIVSTPLILIGMLLAAVYGATLSPHNGRKLYATLERCAYSGGYHRYVIRNENDLQNSLVGLCLQPEPVAHLFGGNIGDRDVW